jgi:hypothetical protein
MDTMNESVVMNNEVDTAVEMEATKPNIGAAIGGVVVGGCAIYGAFKRVKKLVNGVRNKISAAKAKKANQTDEFVDDQEAYTTDEE